MSSPRLSTDTSQPESTLNPLEAYTLADLGQLADFVEDERERLAGADFSSLVTGEEDCNTEAGEGFCEQADEGRATIDQSADRANEDTKPTS